MPERYSVLKGKSVLVAEEARFLDYILMILGDGQGMRTMPTSFGLGELERFSKEVRQTDCVVLHMPQMARFDQAELMQNCIAELHREGRRILLCYSESHGNAFSRHITSELISMGVAVNPRRDTDNIPRELARLFRN